MIFQITVNRARINTIRF